MSQPPKKRAHPIVRHARRELLKAGLFEKQGDYDGSLGPAAMSVVKTFVRVTRGNPARMEAVAQTFNSIIAGDLLSHPTTEPLEWKPMEGADPVVWKNVRSPFFRSNDGGQTWYHSSDPKTVHPSRNHLTGEVPQDGSTDIQKDNTSGSGREGVEESTAADESSSTAESEARRGIDDGVATQSTKDKTGQKITPDEPADWEAE